MSHVTPRCLLALLAIVLSLPKNAAGEDWPQWRHDARRTAHSDERLPESLQPLWHRTLPTPTPAWPESQPSLRFDTSYSPVAAEGLLFVPSMRDDTVRAYALDTGEERWRFTTDGPVRLAPAYDSGKLYFGSDDGYLYCLSATDGTLQWRVSGSPRERRILGNNRLISTWPIRSAPIVADGRVYSTAGVWPFMGVFYHCVDAESGEPIWSNTGESSLYVENPHNAYAFSGLTPRGYPALDEEGRLVIPGGRTPPGVFDRETGGLLEFNWAKQGSRAWNVNGDGRAITVGDETIRAEYDAESGTDTIHVGERQTLSIDGKVWCLLAADGKLVVVTEEGGISCYGAASERGNSAPRLFDTPRQSTEPGTTGFVLLIEDESTDLLKTHAPREIAGRRIILHSNQNVVDAWREQIQEHGAFWPNHAVYHGRLEDFQLPPHFANGVSVSPGSLHKAKSKVEFVDRVWNALRPYGGKAYFWGVEKSTLESWCLAVEGRPVIEEAFSYDGDPIAILTRTGGLPGAADWTHQYGDAANSVVSMDERVKAPLGLLWFGNGPANDEVLPRHGHGPSPQVAGGRLVIEGPDMIRCYDIYTGCLLWQNAMPGLGRFYDNTAHQPGANEIGSNYVTLADAVYVLSGDKIVRLDPTNGSTLNTFTCPGEDGCWGMLAVEGDRLITTSTPLLVEGVKEKNDATEQEMAKARQWYDPIPGVQMQDEQLTWPGAYEAARYSSASAELVVLDRTSGKPRWTRKARYGFRHNNIAASGDRLYAVDALSQAKIDAMKRRGTSMDAYRPTLYAFDIHSGEVLWSTQENVAGTFLNYSAEHDILLLAGSRARDRAFDESGVGMAAWRGETGEVVWADPQRPFDGPCLLWNDRILTQRTSMSLLDGAPVTRVNPISQVESPWTFTRNYGCNTVIASEHLLTFRSGAGGYFDLMRDGGTGNFGGFKSSCTSNLIVAGGLLNAPDYTRTCSCNYQNQTSLAMIHDPEVEQWTFSPLSLDGDVIRRVGLNFGAPGDRKADDGTLWLDIPSGGSASPEVQVDIRPTEGASLNYFRMHSLYVDAKDRSAEPWVAASGVEGVGRIEVAVGPENDPPRAFDVRLVFLEPAAALTTTRFSGQRLTKSVFEKADVPPQKRAALPGERVFDLIARSGGKVNALDVAEQAGGANRPIVKHVRATSQGGKLVFELEARPESRPPVLCGMEIIETN